MPLLLDRYEPLELLGQGGMGEVWKARDHWQQRIVAIKCLHPHLLHDSRALQRFFREGEVLAQISHPNVVGLLSNHAERGLFVMECLEGSSLVEALQRRGRFGLLELFGLFRGICGGLAEAHRRGLVHRDLKPSNIFLSQRPGEEDVVKLLDFGITWVAEESLTATRESLLGTPYYIAPELLKGSHRPSPAADVYSLGVLLYELYTGALPTAGAPGLGQKVLELMAEGKICEAECPPSMGSDYLRLIRGELAPLCQQALQIEAEKRCSLLHFADRMVQMESRYRCMLASTAARSKPRRASASSNSSKVRRPSAWGLAWSGLRNTALTLAGLGLVVGLLLQLDLHSSFSWSGLGKQTHLYSFEKGVPKGWEVYPPRLRPSFSKGRLKLQAGHSGEALLQSRRKYFPGWYGILEFSLRLRLAQRHKSRWGFWKGRRVHAVFRIKDEHLQTHVALENRKGYSTWVFGVDPTKWHSYRIRFALGMVRFYVDGKQVAAYPSEYIATTPTHLHVASSGCLWLQQLRLHQGSTQATLDAVSKH